VKQGWRIKPLGELLEKTETVNPLKSAGTEFNYIDVSSVSNQTFCIEATQRLKGKDAPSRARRLVRANDILFATVRPTLQRIAIVPDELDNQVCSTGYFVLRPKPEMNHRFVFYSLFTESFMDQMATLQKGASYPAVTDGEVRAQLLAFPSPLEQQRIVGILDEAFDGIATAKANAEKNLQNARALFKSYLQSVFIQRGEGWVVAKLEDLCHKITDGTHVTPSYTKEGIPFLSVKNLTKGFIDFSDTRYISLEEHELLTKRWKPVRDDILYTKVGTTGVAQVVDVDTSFSIFVSVALLKPKHDVVFNSYLEHFLNAPFAREQARKRTRGMANKNLVIADIKEIEIHYPRSLRDQRAIVAKLELLSAETQRLESIYQQKLAALEALKKSLLHRAFSGQL